MPIKKIITVMSFLFLILVGLLANNEASASNYKPLYYSVNGGTFLGSSEYPTVDSIILGGVPFSRPGISPIVNTFGSYKTIDFSVNIYGVSTIHTLINTAWGQDAIRGSFAALEFYGSDGAFFRKDLLGNVDIRDWLWGGYTNSLNGTTAINVFKSSGGRGYQARIDKQTTVLPDEFKYQTLETMRVVDYGRRGFQEILIKGLTVETSQIIPSKFPDLGIASNDISFIIVKPDPDVPVDITANIHNHGEADASDVLVEFYDGEEYLGGSSISEILAEETGTANLTTSFATAGIHLITIKVDPLNAIPESNETNNEASQIYQVGDAPATEADIILLNSTPSQIPEGAGSTVSGRALYRVKVGDVVDTSNVVKGANVYVEIRDAIGAVLFTDNTHYTDVNGAYNVPFPAMGNEGDVFDVHVEVTDQSLTGILDTSFRIGPPLPDGCGDDCPELPPIPTPVGGGGSGGGGGAEPPVCDLDCTVEPGIDLSIVSEDIIFSDDNPELGEEITIEVTIRSTGSGKAENIPFRLTATYPTIGTIDIEAYWIIDRIDAGEFLTISFNWRNYAEGVYIIEASFGDGFLDDDNSNNAATREIEIGCDGTATGSGYYYTGRYRTQVSVDVDSQDLSIGTLRYYNSQNRISLTSTSIESVDFPSVGVAVVTGRGNVNRTSGYTFTATITDSTNRWEITILDPGGNSYETGTGDLSRGDLVVTTSEGCGL